MPPVAAAVIAFAIGLLPRAAREQLVPAGLRRAPGGYWYDLTHYATHHRPRTALGEMQRRNHMVHHFKVPDQLYGVTTPLWDFVFGTWPRRAREGDSPPAAR
jgi:sterol desaturase/sphingolipid hydroxylase (fatty acid hydroxylase superfamily)